MRRGLRMLTLRACVRLCEARGFVAVHSPDAMRFWEASESALDDCKAVAPGHTNSRGLFATLEAWHHWVEDNFFSDGVLE